MRTAVVVPATVPSAPTIGTATSGAAGGAITATAAWTAPSSTGGSAITAYTITGLRMSSAGAVLGSTTSALLAAGTRSYSMTLPLAGSYRFTVQASNTVGKSAASTRSNLIQGK